MMSNVDSGDSQKEHNQENDNSDSNGEDEPEYEVEAILGVKAFPKENQLKYLISWVGYGTEYDTWEPGDNLIGAEDALKAFQVAHSAEMEKAQKVIDGYKKKNSTKRDQKSAERKGSPGKKKRRGRPVSSARDEKEFSSTDDDEFVPAKHVKKGRQQAAAAGTSTSEANGEKGPSPPLEFSPRKRHNSWLYKDLNDETDEDMSDGKQEKTDGKKQGRQATSNKSDSAPTGIHESTPPIPSGSPEIAIQIQRAPETTQLTPSQVTPSNENIAPSENTASHQTLEQGDRFVGCIKMPNGTVQMLRSVNGRTELIPIREAHDRFGYEVVEYLIGRGEFSG